MKSSVVGCVPQEPMDACVGLCVCFCLAVIRDMTLCGFRCCQQERALNSSRRFKIKQKGAIMQLNQDKEAAYKAGLFP